MTGNRQESLYIWTSLIVVIIGTFMAILDSSIVNIAISKIMAVFQESVEKARWIITSYTLTLGSIIPLTGYLTDRFGTKRIYVFALSFFTLGSLLCGIAWNTNSMIFFRIIQGLGGGMIMPVSMSIIYQIVPQNQRGLALGIWGIAAMAAPTIGPTLSGYIIEYLDWRLIFTINIPVGIIGTILAVTLLKEFPTKKTGKFDLLGFASSTIGIVFCLYVLGEGSSIDWSDIRNILLLYTGIGFLIVFVVNEIFHPSPLLDLRLLCIFPFSLSIIISSLLNMAMFGAVFIIPLFLQNLRGYTPIQTGLIMLPAAMATGIMMPIGGRLFDKFGPRPLIAPGILLLAFTTFKLASLDADTPRELISFYLILRGISLGLTSMPASTAGMNSVPRELVSRASALLNTIRQLSSSLSVTILTSVLQSAQNRRYAEYASVSTGFNHQVSQVLGYGKKLYDNLGLTGDEITGAAHNILYGIIQKQIFIDGINTTMMTATAFALLTLPFAIFLKKAKSINKEDSVNACSK